MGNGSKTEFMRIEYATANLDKILSFWAKEYKDKKGGRIMHHGTPIVDTHRRTVVFPLYVENDQEVNLTIQAKRKLPSKR